MVQGITLKAPHNVAYALAYNFIVIPWILALRACFRRLRRDLPKPIVVTLHISLLSLQPWLPQGFTPVLWLRRLSYRCLPFLRWLAARLGALAFARRFLSFLAVTYLRSVRIRIGNLTVIAGPLVAASRHVSLHIDNRGLHFLAAVLQAYNTPLIPKLHSRASFFKLGIHMHRLKLRYKGLPLLHMKEFKTKVSVERPLQDPQWQGTGEVPQEPELRGLRVALKLLLGDFDWLLTVDALQAAAKLMEGSTGAAAATASDGGEELRQALAWTEGSRRPLVKAVQALNGLGGLEKAAVRLECGRWSGALANRTQPTLDGSDGGKLRSFVQCVGAGSGVLLSMARHAPPQPSEAAAEEGEGGTTAPAEEENGGFLLSTVSADVAAALSGCMRMERGLEWRGSGPSWEMWCALECWAAAMRLDVPLGDEVPGPKYFQRLPPLPSSRCTTVLASRNARIAASVPIGVGLRWAPYHGVAAADTREGRAKALRRGGCALVLCHFGRVPLSLKCSPGNLRLTLGPHLLGAAAGAAAMGLRLQQFHSATTAAAAASPTKAASPPYLLQPLLLLLLPRSKRAVAQQSPRNRVLCDACKCCGAVNCCSCMWNVPMLL